MIWECAIILGTFLGLLPDFGVPFWAIPGFWGTFLCYSQIFGCLSWLFPGFLGFVFLVKFDFFKNNPDLWVLILIFY